MLFACFFKFLDFFLKRIDFLRLPMENLAVSVKLESGRIALHRGDIVLMIVQNAETMGVRELEQFIQSKGLRDRAVLPDSKNRIQEYIKDAALFVLSSDYEGIPNALIEAMAIGLPCVSTDCSPGGARELINNGENGVIAECGNSDALAKAMVLLLEDRENAQKMGINARRICRRVDKDLVCDRWHDFIIDCWRKENEC